MEGVKFETTYNLESIVKIESITDDDHFGTVSHIHTLKGSKIEISPRHALRLRDAMGRNHIDTQTFIEFSKGGDEIIDCDNKNNDEPTPSDTLATMIEMLKNHSYNETNDIVRSLYAFYNKE